MQEWAEADGKAKSEPLVKRFEPIVEQGELGGVPVLEVRPKDRKDNGKAIVYTHGGAYVMYSAASMLGRSAVAAQETGLRVISIDYTLAPHARYNQISDQAVAAIQALLKQGQRLEDTAIYGDSAGGGLAAATVLKMRDRGLGMPAAAVLVSPWLDVTPSGDTETTLHDADPNQLYEKHGKYAAAAFADPKDQEDPYASPVYGDFSKGFPPTLIQGGLKETLLSGFVRLYRGPGRGASAGEVGFVRRDDSQLPGQNSRCAGVDPGAKQNAGLSISTPANVRIFRPMRNDETGPWSRAALTKLEEWDPRWTAACTAISTNPWTSCVLSRKFVELISLAINVACTNLNADGTRRHVRAALDAGASRDEVLFVFKCATAMAIHSCSLGAPILLEEAQAAGVAPKPAPTVATPAVDKMKAIGQWNAAWDPFIALDPAWTDAFMAMGAGIYGSGVLPPKEIELLSVAFDASFTHMYAPGTRRHIRNALKAGASIEEVFEVLKLCVAQGVQACNLGVPILQEELEARTSPSARG